MFHTAQTALLCLLSRLTSFHQLANPLLVTVAQSIHRRFSKFAILDLSGDSFVYSQGSVAASTVHLEALQMETQSYPNGGTQVDDL